MDNKLEGKTEESDPGDSLFLPESPRQMHPLSALLQYQGPVSLTGGAAGESGHCLAAPFAMSLELKASG